MSVSSCRKKKIKGYVSPSSCDSGHPARGRKWVSFIELEDEYWRPILEQV